MQELKRCPFCGSEAEYLETQEVFGYPTLCLVRCKGDNGACYCQTTTVVRGSKSDFATTGGSPDFDPKEKLIDIWNRRVSGS